MKIIRPKALQSGDTLGVVACSTPIDISGEATIQRSYGFLKNKGFNIVEAPNCRSTYGHSAGTLKERVSAMHSFFRNKEIDGILSYWGGFQSHQLLDYLDFDLIKSNPKPFIGFSDTTALQVGIFAKTGLVTFSGPAGLTFGKPTVPDFTWRNFEKILMTNEAAFELSQSHEYSENPWWAESSKSMVFKPNEGWRIFRKGQAEGFLIGGNLGTMLLLAGTPYWPKLDGAILFVEEDEAESPKTVDRMFTQLRQMGVYDRIAGMIVGRFQSSVGYTENDSLEMILTEALRGYKFPVITNLDFGHTDPLLTLPIGVKCQIKTSKPQINLLGSAVKK